MKGSRIDAFERLPDRLALSSDDGRLELVPYGDRILRIRLDPEGRFEDRPEALVVASPEGAERWTLAEEPGTGQAPGPDADGFLVYASPCLVLRIRRSDGAFEMRDASGRTLFRDPPGRARILERTACDVPPRVAPTSPPVAASAAPRAVLVDGVDGPVAVAQDAPTSDAVSSTASPPAVAYHTRLRLSPGDDEALFGLGQHEEDRLDVRGTVQYLYQHNLKVSLPVLLSSRGYGWLFDTGSAALFRDDDAGTWFWTDCDRYLDAFFVHGDGADGVVAGLRRLTGKAVQLPRWTLGYVQSKEHYHTQDEILETARRLREESVPVDCVVQDWQSWERRHWGQKSFDRARYPDPAGMVRELHERRIRYMHSIWPVMKAGCPDHAEMRAAGCLYANDYTYDPFLPEARDLYWTQTKREVLPAGTDAFWCDCTEPFKWDWGFRDLPDPIERFTRTVAEFKRWMDPRAIQEYSLYHARGLYEHWRAEDDARRPAVLIRSGYPGQQRYGTVVWSGDICARWDVLRASVPSALSFCLCGIPFWTLDIGAFFTVDNPRFWCMSGDYPGGCDDPGYRELYVRWFQFGAFLPMMRAHGTDTPREPWRFGARGTPHRDALDAALRLRYGLLPYFASLMGWTWHRDYTPMRALVFDFPLDREALRLRDQYLYGPHLLVCPVVEPGAVTRSVHLPEGCGWTGFHTGVRYDGGQRVLADAPLDRIPLFVRDGAVLPMSAQDDLSCTDDWDPSRLRVHVYPGADGAFDYWEDAGDGHGYERGEWRILRMAWDDAEKTLRIEPQGEGYPGEPEERDIEVIVHGPDGLRRERQRVRVGNRA